MSDLAVPLAPPRAAPWTAYTTLVRWQMAQIGTTLLPLVIVVQALMAAG